jgi:hypothetical protein
MAQVQLVSPRRRHPLRLLRDTGFVGASSRRDGLGRGQHRWQDSMAEYFDSVPADTAMESAIRILGGAVCRRSCDTGRAERPLEAGSAWLSPTSR